MSNENKNEFPGSQTPWLDCSGKTICDTKLKQISRKWTAQEWDSYLTHLEVPLREELEWKFDSQLEERLGTYTNDSFEDSHEQLEVTKYAQALCRRAIKQLTPTQKSVINLTFWKGLNETEVANKMGINRISIRTHLSRAIARLREIMSPSLRLVEGQNKIRGNKQGVFGALKTYPTKPGRCPKP